MPLAFIDERLIAIVVERRALALFVVCHAVLGDSIPNSVDERLGPLLAVAFEQDW